MIKENILKPQNHTQALKYTNILYFALKMEVQSKLEVIILNASILLYMNMKQIQYTPLTCEITSFT